MLTEAKTCKKGGDKEKQTERKKETNKQTNKTKQRKKERKKEKAISEKKRDRKGYSTETEILSYMNIHSEFQQMMHQDFI